MQGGPGLDDLTIRRWRRYGHDRLYVKSADTDLGWVDLNHDRVHADDEATVDILQSVLAEWRREFPAAPPASEPPSDEPELAPEPVAVQPPPIPAENVQPTPPPTKSARIAAPPPPAAAPWEDLALRKAGEGVRAEAKAARAEAPFMTLVDRVLRIHNQERAWRVGAEGEEAVGKVLDGLPGWRTLHSVPVGDRGSDIDHVVIGPGGVFTVNTKTHPGADVWVAGNGFLVNRSKTHYVRNARHEAERAASRLSDACASVVPVQGVIVVMRAQKLTLKAPANGVDVISGRGVTNYFTRRGRLFDDATVTAVYELARRSTTWR